jgi:hypothetical protein
MGTAIENRLTEDLHASVAGMHLPPGLLAAARRRHHRRRLTVRVVTGATVAAAVTGVVATAMTGGSARAPHREAIGNSASTSATVTAPRLETVAYVRQRIAQAPDPEHAIVRRTARTTDATVRNHRGHVGPTATDDQVNDNWADPDTGYNTDYTTERGQLISASRYPIARAGRDLEIDYVARTWYSRPVSAVPQNAGTSGKVGEPRIDTVAGIKAAVQRSDVTVLGHGTVADRPATHIRFAYRSGDGPSTNTITGDAWFDSQTFAPLRATTTYASSPASAAPPVANGDPAGSASAPTITVTASFLPRTAANLARTRLVVPTGFRQVSPRGES